MARTLLHIPQHVVAEETGIHVQTLKRWEGGSGILAARYDAVKKLQDYYEDKGLVFGDDFEVRQASASPAF